MGVPKLCAIPLFSREWRKVWSEAVDGARHRLEHQKSTGTIFVPKLATSPSLERCIAWSENGNHQTIVQAQTLHENKQKEHTKFRAMHRQVQDSEQNGGRIWHKQCSERCIA